MPSVSNAAVIENCHRILSRHARSFSWAARLLPKKMYDEAAILYAFCRVVDDAVDTADNQEDARQSIRYLTAELLSDTPEQPIIRAFKEINHTYPLSILAAQHLIDGVSQDIAAVKIQNDPELLRYCYKVAGTPGLMMCPIIGVKNIKALPFAIDLGIAMQLTNICRDIAEDAQQNRVYIPNARLQKVDIKQNNVLTGEFDPHQLMPVVEDLLTMAERYYQSGNHGMRYIPFLPRCAIIVASRLYRAIGRKVKRKGIVALKTRTAVTPVEKMILLINAVALSMLSPIMPIFRKQPHDQSLHTGLEELVARDYYQKIFTGDHHD